MKEYLEKRREELRKESGFTLMEMLIVVAIIAVLVAIAIPVFTSQLERSREATDLANIRSAYAEAMTGYIATNSTQSASAKLVQKDATWHIDHSLTTRIDGSEGSVSLGDVSVGGTAIITVSAPAAGSTAPTVSVSYSAAG